jgi:hypothetical protein
MEETQRRAGAHLVNNARRVVVQHVLHALGSQHCLAVRAAGRRDDSHADVSRELHGRDAGAATAAVHEQPLAGSCVAALVQRAVCSGVARANRRTLHSGREDTPPTPSALAGTRGPSASLRMRRVTPKRSMTRRWRTKVVGRQHGDAHRHVDMDMDTRTGTWTWTWTHAHERAHTAYVVPLRMKRMRAVGVPRLRGTGPPRRVTR